MGTLVYAPGAEIKIATQDGILDVTPDISRGSITLSENAPSQCRFMLLNHRRKYDGVFTPNDRITIKMKRFKWLQIMSGYLNALPYFSIYPRTIPISASCTLKRLQYRVWDAGSTAAVNLLNGIGQIGKSDEVDGGLRDKLKILLTDVGEWPQETIHIGYLPASWLQQVEDLRGILADQLQADSSLLGTSGIINGASPLQGTASFVDPTAEAIPKGAGQLPATIGKISYFGTEATGGMQLTGEKTANPQDAFYSAMRWPYADPNGTGGSPATGLTMADYNKAKGWWKNKKILVYNQRNNRAVVLRAADWGPHISTGRVIDVSPTAIEALGAVTNDIVEIRFPPDQSIAVGRQDTITRAPSSPTTVPDNPLRATASGPTTIQGASGLRFASADNLKGNVTAARQLIQASWNVTRGIGGFATSGHATNSDHYKGLALDVIVSSGAAQGSDKQLGNAVAMWFVANPHVFGTKYVIWYERINTGTGWKPYTQYADKPNDDSLQHRNHVHISFNDTGQTSPGSMGDGWVGGTLDQFTEGIASANNVNLIAAGQGWYPTPDVASNILSGPRRYMNDDPLLSTVSAICNASMRSFMSAPNGDFIAWFPDYFGAYGLAGKLYVEDIELMGDGFTIEWDDSRLVTHQYTAGSFTATSFGATPGGSVEAVAQYMTQGIASVEFPEMMQALFNIPKDDPRAKVFLQPDVILKRFGVRPNFQPIGVIAGPVAEFWTALWLFQRNWASQFSSQIDLTFMPEVYPGMLLRFERYGLQCYVTQVTHSFSFTEGGGFTTSATVIAPSATDGSGLYALPRADTLAKISPPSQPAAKSGSGMGSPTRLQ